MAKKADKAVRELAKEVKKLRKESERLAKTLEGVREAQSDSHREILALLEERLTPADTGADEPEEYRGILDEDGTVGTDATTDATETAESADGDVPEASAAAQQERREPPEITDAARRRAKELGVDPMEVKGTGSGGRVLVKDVEAAAGG